MATLSMDLSGGLSAGRHKLLLVDDSVAIQKVVQLTFTDEGYEVAIAGNGVDALRLLEEFRPAVMLVDVSMPGLNGYEVCRRIRRDERFKHLPVLLLVGIFEPFDPKEAREAGADDVLTKPFQSIREMLNKVGAYLTGRPYEEPEYDSRPLRIDAPPVTSPPPPAAAPPPQPVAHEDKAENLSSVEPASSAFSGADTHAAVAMPEEPAEELAKEPISIINSTDGIDGTDSLTTDELDERTVEVKPPIDFADNKMSSSSSASAVETSMIDESALMASTADTDELKPTNMESQMSLSSDRYPEPAFSSTVAPRTPSSSDDSLLDLGETPLTTAASSVPTISDQDDMILDLGDEPVYSTAAASRSQSAGNSSLSADQLSPEIIDAIARRVAEHLSTRAIEDVAWEVVPQLAELLIKQQLEAGKARKM